MYEKSIIAVVAIVVLIVSLQANSGACPAAKKADWSQAVNILDAKVLQGMIVTGLRYDSSLQDGKGAVRVSLRSDSKSVKEIVDGLKKDLPGFKHPKSKPSYESGYVQITGNMGQSTVILTVALAEKSSARTDEPIFSTDGTGSPVVIIFLHPKQ